MSKRGSNINSPLFKSDPVPIRKSKIPGTNNKEGSFFVKGNPNTTFERKIGSDDVFVVNSRGTKFEVDRNSFKDTLLELKKYAHVPVKILKKDQLESFDSVVVALGLLYETGKLYEIIHTDIQQIFADIKTVIPGTLAAFFIGCSTNDNFNGPLGCNPKCAASLPPGEKIKGYTICDDLVLLYDNSGLSSLNDKMSIHSYIHIEDSNFTGFTSDDIKQLSDAHIESVTLVYGNSEGIYTEIVNALPLDKLPLRAETTLGQNESNSDTNSNAGIAFAILIVIIIIILLIILYQSTKR